MLGDGEAHQWVELFRPQQDVSSVRLLIFLWHEGQISVLIDYEVGVLKGLD